MPVTSEQAQLPRDSALRAYAIEQPATQRVSAAIPRDKSAFRMDEVGTIYGESCDSATARAGA